MSTFAGSLSGRALDPVLPQVAADLAVTIQVAATLASAFAVTFALIQPGLGIVADMFGKPKLILICLALLGVSNIAGAMSTSFDMLLITRVLSGIGGGGVFPITLSLVGDLFPLRERQVAMSRILAGAMAGNLLGASLSGVIGDFIGWRGVLMGIGLLVIVASVAVGWGFRAQMRAPRKQINLADIGRNYRVILQHPYARLCYPAVFIEGCCVLGVFPFVAAFLVELGEPRLSIAGVVIAGFAVGGLVYTSSVSRLLPRARREGADDRRRLADRLAAHRHRVRATVAGATRLLHRARLRLLHDPRIAADFRIGDFGRGAQHRGRTARLLLLSRPDGGAAGLRLRALRPSASGRRCL